MSDKANKRVGILGGTFNPIHTGHLILAQHALDEYELDEILFIPVGTPYFKDPSAVLSKQHRIAMVTAAIKDNPKFALSTVETDREGISYTYETLQVLKKDNPNTDYYLILGADTLYQIESWREPDIIMANAGILAAVRDGKSTSELKNKAAELMDKYHNDIHILTMPATDISSTDIRARVGAGRSIRYMVPEGVRTYIEKNNLYRD